MTRKRHGFKTLGLCALMALSALAFAAAPANAEGEFIVGGATLKAQGIKTESISGSAGQSTFLVPGIGLELTCASAQITGQIEAGGHGKQTMSFTGCAIAGAPQCEVDPIEAKFLISVELHAGETWLLYKPLEAGQPFTIIYALGALCTFPEENELTGSFVSLVSSEALVKQTLTFKNDHKTVSSFEKLGIFISYAFGIEPALIDISTVVQLSGAKAGKTWTAE
jgi:hypothetical protein